ncbi:MAG TPA: barstar family protein [Burkholderiales bacterium]|nr:barstar family protein [Burkholderiales bacterium]
MKYDGLLRPERSGVYAAPRWIGPLRAAAQRAGIAWRELDAGEAHNKQAFLAACAQQLGFPPYFGHNWDALSECLKDFSWEGAPDCVIVWRGTEALGLNEPDALATALEVFRDAAQFWKERCKTFVVLLDREPAGARLPRLR